MLGHLGRLMYRARWVVVAVWVLLFALSAIFAPRVTGILRGGGYSIGSSESIAAYNTLNHAYGYRALTFTVVFSAPPGGHGRLLTEARRFRAEARRRYGAV